MPLETPIGPLSVPTKMMESFAAGSEVPSMTDRLVSLCLLAKLWGEFVPIPSIIFKTKLDRKHV